MINKKVSKRNEKFIQLELTLEEPEFEIKLVAKEDTPSIIIIDLKEDN